MATQLHDDDDRRQVDGGIGGVRGDVGMEGSSFARFLGLVPKRGFVWSVLEFVRFVADFLDLVVT